MTDVFRGKITGFPEIAVDYFLGDRLTCSAFFLSHCHTDHIKGLDSREFQFKALQTADIKIYCTFVTASLVLRRSKLSYLKPLFVFLEKNETYTLPVSKTETINVVLLDAHHCPGSVMFLFSRGSESALYTGDFRISQDTSISDTITETHINYLYVDTTFFAPKISAFKHFPSRRESEDAVIRFVVREREQNKAVQVHIDITPGWENMFIVLSDHFDCDVQVTDELYQEYEDIEQILFHLTKEKSWIHINKTNAHCTLCDGETVKLRPSVQWKLHNNMLDSSAMIAAKSGTENLWYITHSMHSSYTECKYFIEQVAADRVYPIATPPKTTNEQIVMLLKKYWKPTTVQTRTVISDPSPSTGIVGDEESLDEASPQPPPEESLDGVVSSESDDCLPIITFHNKTDIVALQNEIDVRMAEVKSCTEGTHQSQRDKPSENARSSNRSNTIQYVTHSVCSDSVCRSDTKGRRKRNFCVSKSRTILDSSSDSDASSCHDNSSSCVGESSKKVLISTSLDKVVYCNREKHTSEKPTSEKPTSDKVVYCNREEPTSEKHTSEEMSRIDKFMDSLMSSESDNEQHTGASNTEPVEVKHVDSSENVSEEAVMDRIMNDYFGFNLD